jgi:hypothetical protein
MSVAAADNGVVVPEKTSIVIFEFKAADYSENVGLHFSV